MKRYLIATTLLLLSASGAMAQDFTKDQQSQERTIKAAQKKGSITDREYEKLMEEQTTIRKTIAEAEDDGVWTSKEKNAVAGKLERAGKRLRRYKNNGEVY